MISPAFIEANYEALESLLRDRRRQMRNNDLRTELEYFSEDYDEEREMEQIPEPTRAATLPLQVASPRICRRGERTVEFERDQSRGESRVERNTEGGRPLEEAPRGNGGQSVNLPSLLAAHSGRGENGQPLSWVYMKNNESRTYQGPNHGLFPSLSKSPKEILATEKAARSFEPPPKMFRSRHLRTQIQEAMNSGQLLHLVKVMQRMGIVVSTIHGAIKFHTKKGIGTILLADETDEGTKRTRKILAINEERVLSWVNVEEKNIVNDKYPDQTVTIKKQLPEHFKKELQNLLKSNADVFA
ncbi:hypothetical protein Tco_0287595 [Tanacetum coccineum]